MQALAGATTALTAYNAYQGMQNPNTSGGGVGISITVGGSKSKDTSSVTTDTAAASTVAAGGDVTILASGAGEQSDITVQGSQISAGRDLTLIAEDDINLLAAANTASVERSSKSSSAGVGVAITYGSDGFAFGITANASAARGNAEGDDLIWSNTHLSAGETLTLRSGDDTTLKAAVASGERVVADVGGDLSIESLQDISTFESRDKSAGGSVTIGYGFAGSVQVGQAKIDSDFASVAEQSALRAGDGGFDVRVGGDTTLTGGAITSTDAAVDGGLNRFETGGELALTDIENRAEYKASSYSVGFGGGVAGSGSNTLGGTNLMSVSAAPTGSAGVGSDSDKASSTTVAAISGIAGNVDARTGEAETGIAPIFDADKVKREIDAQVAITQAFGPRAAKAWGDYANTKALEAAARGDFEEAENWAEGGAYRVAGHTLLGALSGGVDGAAGGLVSSVAMKHVAELLKQTDLPEGAQSALSATISASLGSIAGPTGAAVAFNVDTNNRQLHPDEVKWIRENAKAFAALNGDMSENEAIQRLAQQALKQVDYLWRAQLADGDDLAAKEFLTGSQGSFVNDLGENQSLFTATGQQLLRPEMFADIADPAFYKAFVHSGISRDLNTGLLKELRDSGVEMKDGALDLLKFAADNPAVATDAVLNAVWEVVSNIGGIIHDSLVETGHAIGEGSAVALNADLTEKLGAIYGTDVASIQKAILAIRVTAAVTGATSSAKLASELTGAVGKKLDDVAADLAIKHLAEDAATANAKLTKLSDSTGDGPYNAPTHTSAERFQTHGLSVEQVPASIRIQLTQDLQSTFGPNTPSVMEEIISSGKSVPFPIAATSETKLYRIQVEGRDFNSQSVYYMDASQLQRVQSNPQLLQDMMGLPPGSKGVSYSVYERQPLTGQNPTIYQSDIATVTTNAGTISAGSGVQTILPNGSLWSPPVKIATFSIER